jgi:SPP1 family predicted phage head-tail adaptor
MNVLDRDCLVTFQRATTTTDDYGGETQSWTDLQKAWARVRFGTAQERRQAAQESSSQSATFECNPTAALRSVGATDRIAFDGSDWDIQGPGELLDRMTIRFTAVRSA